MNTKEKNLQEINNFFNTEMIIQCGGRSGFVFSNGKGAIAYLENHRDNLSIEVKIWDGEDIERMLCSTIDYFDSDTPVYKDFYKHFSKEIYFSDSLEEYEKVIKNKLNEIS